MSFKNDVTLNSEGYYRIGNILAGDEITSAKSYEIAYYANITPKSAINLSGNYGANTYVFGTPGTVIQGLTVKYWV